MISKTKKTLFIFLILVFMFFVGAPIFAHPGRTDSSGCHTCRTNCASWGLSTGEYHCHRAKALPQPKEPIKSHKVEGGTGYITPAPEYKIPKIDENANTTTKQDVKSSTTDIKISFWGKILSFLGWR